MFINMSEIAIYRFLNFGQAESLKAILNRHSIVVFIKVNPDDQTKSSYHVYINEKDLVKAKPLIFSYRKILDNDIQRVKLICPICKSQPPFTGRKKKISLLLKLISIGTVVMECHKCKHIWYI